MEAGMLELDLVKNNNPVMLYRIVYPWWAGKTESRGDSGESHLIECRRCKAYGVSRISQAKGQSGRK